ncbi:MAG: hypothetical protein H0Z35_13840 [Thermoanaerobacteraceae bacterium]|nr:hypothetical protein [Thermoanaerobacteraceae bacterium]
MRKKKRNQKHLDRLPHCLFEPCTGPIAELIRQHHEWWNGEG